MHSIIPTPTPDHTATAICIAAVPVCVPQVDSVAARAWAAPAAGVGVLIDAEALARAEGSIDRQTAEPQKRRGTEGRIARPQHLDSVRKVDLARKVEEAQSFAGSRRHVNMKVAVH